MPFSSDVRLYLIANRFLWAVFPTLIYLHESGALEGPGISMPWTDACEFLADWAVTESVDAQFTDTTEEERQAMQPRLAELAGTLTERIGDEVIRGARALEQQEPTLDSERLVHEHYSSFLVAVLHEYRGLMRRLDTQSRLHKRYEENIGVFDRVIHACQVERAFWDEAVNIDPEKKDKLLADIDASGARLATEWREAVLAAVQTIWDPATIQREQNTVSSMDWNTRFESAVTAYTMAAYWVNRDAADRQAAAAAFRDLSDVFRTADASARQVLKSALPSSDVIRRNTAVRLLVEVHDREALPYLVDRLERSEQPSLEPVILRLLGSEPSLQKRLWQILPQLQLFEQAPVLESLLAGPSEAGLEFVAHRIANGGSAITGTTIVKALARWKRNDLLQTIMDNPPQWIEPDQPHWLETDPGLEAAFYLALTGERKSIQFLEEAVSGPNPIRAAQAALRLAWLAWPGVIAPTMALLRSEDTYAASLALHAVSVLSCAAFGPVLLALARRTDLFEPTSGISLSDEAIRVLERISGQPFPEASIEYAPGKIPDTFTEATRHEAISFYGGAIKSLDAARRYERGELLTLAHLAENLLSAHEGPRHAAAYNLRAITGEDLGFDPDLDLIANLPAILAWRERAKRPDPLIPGGWAFAGAALPDPQME